MNLKTKAFLIVALAVSTGVGVLATIGQVVIMKGFRELETREASFHANRVKSVVEAEKDFLANKVGDWGIWDDAYQFVNGNAPGFIETNFPDTASSTIKVGLIAIANHDGVVLGSNAYDYRNEKAVPLQDGVVNFLKRKDLHHFETASEVKTGILRLSEGVLIYAAVQVRTSDEAKAAPGTVLMGNWLDNFTVSKFAKTVQLDLEFETYPSGVSIPNGSKAYGLTPQVSTRLTPESDALLTATTVFFDTKGDAAAVITAKLNRDILARGGESVRAFTVMLAVGGLILTVLLTVLIQKGVVSRIIGLSRAVTDIGARHDLGARVPESGSDELRLLSREINGMLGTIAEKTGQMTTILTHINQGILMLDQDGVVRGETSTAFGKMTGVSRADGRKIDDIVFGRTDLSNDARSQIDAFLGNSVGEDVLNFEANRDILPREVGFHSGVQRRYFETDWLPIVAPDDTVERVMLTLRDVTELKALKEATEKSREEVERLVQIIGQPALAVDKFFQSASNYLGAIRETMSGVQAVSDLTDEKRSLIRRSLHTLKGNARAMGFSFLTELVHEAEDKVFLLLAGAISSADGLGELRQVLAEQTKAIDAELALYLGASARLQAHGSGLSKEAQADNPLRLDEVVHRVVHFVDRTLQQSGKNDAQIKESYELKFLALSLLHETLSDYVKKWELLASSLAVELNRKAPVVQLKSDIDMILTSEAERALSDGMMHMVRNSLDHGFKDGQIMPEIHLEIQKLPGGKVSMIYRDNGVGLNLAKIRSVAADRGNDVTNLSDNQIADLIFVDGVSTSDQVTDISGRGTGMAAVRSFFENLGGQCRVEVSDKNNVYGNRNFYFVIEFGKGAILCQSSPNLVDIHPVKLVSG